MGFIGILQIPMRDCLVFAWSVVWSCALGGFTVSGMSRILGSDPIFILPEGCLLRISLSNDHYFGLFSIMIDFNI